MMINTEKKKNKQQQKPTENGGKAGNHLKNILTLRISNDIFR